MALIGVTLVGQAMLMMPQTLYATGFSWHFFQGSNSGAKNNPNSEFSKRLPMAFKDDIRGNQKVNKIILTAKQKNQATAWGLSDGQEQRYVALMQNQSGYFFKSMTPVQVLGANARSNQERIKYADQDAKQQFQYLAKYLSYNAQYQKSADALKKKLNLPVVLPFNTAQYSPYHYKAVALKADDKLMLFVKPSSEVSPIMVVLMNELKSIKATQLNVYFVGKVDHQQVNRWANHQNIPQKMVSTGRITLNEDHGKFAGLESKKHELPALVLLRDGKSQFVDLSRF